MKHKLPDATADDARRLTETDEKNRLLRVNRTQQSPHSQKPASELLDQLERFAPLPCVLPDDDW